MRANKAVTIFGLTVLATIATVIGHVTAAQAGSCYWAGGWLKRFLCGVLD
jgi:hypothetical protein